jgi:hypothetical protein
MKHLAAAAALAVAVALVASVVRLPDMWDDDPHYRP